jgi:hypothetical protein
VIPLQFANPLLQLEITGTPPEQPTVPFATGNGTLPQLPQFAKLVLIFVSQPFIGLLSQSANPALQLRITHVPPEQPEIAFGNAQT